MKRDSGYSVNWIVSLPRPFKKARLGGISGDLRVVFLTAGLCGDKTLCCRFVDDPTLRISASFAAFTIFVVAPLAA